MTFYVVDRHNRIVDVGVDWDGLALAAGGSDGALRAQVVGQPLQRFVAGDQTRMFVMAALDTVRHLGRPRVLPYRCDNPSERRRFEMRILPLADSTLRVEHHLVSSEARSLPSRPNRALPRSGWRCSQCLAVRLAGAREWVELEGALPLAQDLCERCAARLFEPRGDSAE